MASAIKDIGKANLDVLCAMAKEEVARRQLIWEDPAIAPIFEGDGAQAAPATASSTLAAKQIQHKRAKRANPANPFGPAVSRANGG